MKRDFEKLGAFYLGRHEGDLGNADSGELLLYDSKDLTTHGVCVGMTGSGKTGLCLALLEEAALDGIPSIVIDPKGDLSNIALTFPRLRPEDFRPWVDEGEATRKGRTMDEHARKTAETWREGLADWGQGPERIRNFKQAAEVVIYTPGSSAGRPLAVLKSLDAPPQALLDDADGLRDRVQGAVSSLLALLDIDADPMRSREHVLLSAIIDKAWAEGRSLDIAKLIRQVQKPPFDRLGVFELDEFFPASDRMMLAMQLNTLLASSSFKQWMDGEALDVKRLLHGPDGRPRISVLSIAHLSDKERMFFVSFLLNEVVSWMRTQAGTSSLRALLYMDEVFGYLPPTANPPSKRPLLTMLKQARAYGLGVLLATQNPVDLDYKALSNIGTWFLGRLQTERDKLRVMDGLEGADAGAGLTRQDLERLLSSLESRVFLMHDVHEDGPVTFRVRWVMSYLRGPLTRAQLKSLTAGAAPAPAVKTVRASPAARKAIKQAEAITDTAEAAPIVPLGPDSIPVAWLPRQGALHDGDRLVYRPAALVEAEVHHVRASSGVDRWKRVALLADLPTGKARRVDWDTAREIVAEDLELDEEGDRGAAHEDLIGPARSSKSWTSWKKACLDHLYRDDVITLYKCKKPKGASTLDEDEAEFRGRLAQLAREARDLKVEKLRKKGAPKIARLQERIRKAEAKIGKENEQYGAKKMQAAISIGATIMGALFGRKLASAGNIGRASTAMRGTTRAANEKHDIERAQADLEALQLKLEELEESFAAEIEEAQEPIDATSFDLQTILVRPRKSDLSVDRLMLVWTPWCIRANGNAEPLF